ncbi:MAG: exodeoxyribonuclease III [Gammaproteobacteria bacterium]|nr:exodeoxyribonuclease III [Gammaproteobacteria bacterium]
MRIITINVNGIRAAIKKGLIDWLLRTNADVICLQETKMHTEEDPAMLDILPGYRAYYYDAQKKGYSGVALLTRLKPDAVHYGLGLDYADLEGRYIQADFGPLSVVSLYLPSGSSGPERQEVKFQFLADYLPILKKQLTDGRSYIIGGDWNIAHKAIDLKNWRANQKNSGFLPEERAWMDELLDTMGWVDAFRVINQEPDQYTWWSYRGQAKAKNVGWRIDYQIVSPNLREHIQQVEIYTEQCFSDHAPLIIDYRLP